MARTRTQVVEAPPQRDVYFWMLVVTAAAMVVGIAALLLDLGGYDSSEAKGTPALSLPKVQDLQAKTAGPANNPPQ